MEKLEYYYSAEVKKLQILLEEVTRAKPGAPESRFVEPDDEIVDKLTSRFHHVLYGRRGTGKSSLLREIQVGIQKEGGLVAWADQETFKALSYPDVLVGVLAEVFTQFADQIEEKAPQGKVPWWKIKRRKMSDEQIIVKQLRISEMSLRELKKAPNESDVEWTQSQSEELYDALNSSTSAEAVLKSLRAEAAAKSTRSKKANRGSELFHKYTATKTEHLERALSSYRALMKAVGQMYPDSYIILDDFYQLQVSDQPYIAGYFHRAVKDTDIWLKFGSISLWTKLYAGGSPPVGVQVPNDAKSLTLDRGLQQFLTSKRFLEEILKNLCDEVSVEFDRLFSSGSLDRLVLAAGGGPRDYIGLVSGSIAIAKDRGPSSKGGSERVIAEDVNKAAGRSVENKFNEMAEDTQGEAPELRKLVGALTDHCRNTKSACFLIDSNDELLVDKIKRLQNMRFVHLIDTNETLPNENSDRYNVYVLDVSQLAAQRASRVEFMGWTERKGRRARKLVFSSPE